MKNVCLFFSVQRSLMNSIGTYCRFLAFSYALSATLGRNDWDIDWCIRAAPLYAADLMCWRWDATLWTYFYFLFSWVFSNEASVNPVLLANSLFSEVSPKPPVVLKAVLKLSGFLESTFSINVWFCLRSPKFTEDPPLTKPRKFYLVLMYRRALAYLLL